MKKLLAVLLIVACSALWAEEEAGDASGNDLDPVLKGLHSTMSGGIFAVVGGKAADYADPIGSVVNLSFGYDLQIVDAFSLGLSAKFGILQLNTVTTQSASPWYKTGDYAPIVVGADISPTYCIDERWEIGANVSIDYNMMAKAKDSSGKEQSGFLVVGGGVDAEYYTYARHFSFGMMAEFNYIVNFDGFGVTVMPYLKYSFGI